MTPAPRGAAAPGGCCPWRLLLCSTPAGGRPSAPTPDLFSDGTAPFVRLSPTARTCTVLLLGLQAAASAAGVSPAATAANSSTTMAVRAGAILWRGKQDGNVGPGRIGVNHANQPHANASGPCHHHADRTHGALLQLGVGDGVGRRSWRRSGQSPPQHPCRCRCGRQGPCSPTAPTGKHSGGRLDDRRV